MYNQSHILYICANIMASMEFNNFKEIVKRYLTLNNNAKQYMDQSKQLKSEIDEMIREKVEARTVIKAKVGEQRKQMEAIEPYIMKFMKKIFNTEERETKNRLHCV